MHHGHASTHTHLHSCTHPHVHTNTSHTYARVRVLTQGGSMTISRPGSHTVTGFTQPPFRSPRVTYRDTPCGLSVMDWTLWPRLCTSVVTPPPPPALPHQPFLLLPHHPSTPTLHHTPLPLCPSDHTLLCLLPYTTPLYPSFPQINPLPLCP